MDFANYSIMKSFMSKYISITHKVEYNATGLHAIKEGYKRVNWVQSSYKILIVETLCKDGFKVIE